MTDNYGVFGNPVKHSRSPDIHAQFAIQTGQDISYQRQLVELGGFRAAADSFFARGGRGLNITLPFKVDAYEYAGKLTSRARRAQAVNTLFRQDSGVILGDNTDGAGMVRDMVVNLGWALAAKNILILGAGGAVRGVLEPLLEQKPAAVTIANRTEAKAVDLANAFADLGVVVGCGFSALAGQQFDVIINGTSASLSGDLPPLPETLVTPATRCYDMMYGSEPTVFLRWVETLGAVNRADGLGMLVEQAAESFRLWRGVLPNTAAVIAHLRATLAEEAGQ
ncbi:MAG: shikimate dehydrogenase [Porticoccaceae bacterium]|nr:shikimate dehydrogenase [Porticoccaceae bacterium]